MFENINTDVFHRLNHNFLIATMNYKVVLTFLILDLFMDKQNGENYINKHNSKSIESTLNMADDEKLDIKLFKKTFNEKQNIDQKKVLINVQDKINDSLRDLCLPKLLCEIAAKPTYLLSDKERHVLSLLK